MSTMLALHHVGEVVVSGLLDGLAQRELLRAVPCKLHPDCSFMSVLTDSAIKPPYLFAHNVPLAPVGLGGKVVQFDGAHGVDVLCHDGRHGLAVEAKLGLDRLTRRAFTDRFLGGVTLSEHKTQRFVGSMTAILNARAIDGMPLTLRTQEPSVELTRPCFLVVRAKTWSSWGSDPPTFSNAHVATFEDIAGAYGDASAFDALVRAHVGGGFHSAWKVSQ
jgi:hypothetical protein